MVKIQEQTLAEDHPSRLPSQEVMATLYRDIGRGSAALQLAKRVVEIGRQVPDEHHPDRISSETWLEIFNSELGM